MEIYIQIWKDNDNYVFTKNLASKIIYKEMKD